MNEQGQHALPAPASPDTLAPAPAGHGGTIRKILIVLVIAAAVGAAVWKIRANGQEQTAAANKLSAAGDRAIPVAVSPVQQKTMPIYLTALGTVTAYNSVTIKTRVDGQLMSVPVREGQAVKKGQVLAEIDPRPYEAALAQAEGQLVKDQANSKNAEAEAQRYTALYQAGVVSKESQQSQVSTAGQAAGSIASDQAAIQAAKVNVAYTRITSPIDGIVGLRQVDPGNIVHASDSTGLLLVTQLQPIAVIFTLPEDQLPEVLTLVRGGQKLTVNAYDRSESTQLGTGTLLTLDNQIDPTTGTDKVKAVFPNKDGALFPNQFVNVRLILQQRQNALVVPAAAIQTGSQGSFVYVVKKGDPPASLAGAAGGASGHRRSEASASSGGSASSGEASTTGSSSASSPHASGANGQAGGGRPPADPYYVVAQPVKIDVTEGTQVILSSGLNPGDQVVVDGQEKLLNGSKVSPTVQKTFGPRASGASATSGEATAAFGPEGAGPSEPSAAPAKQGVETGSGIRPGTVRGPITTGLSQDGQPHSRRHQNQPPAQSGQQP